jgi:aspartyl-tRNA(Asn)/glutamyl-tRNA(Gln) amidotransferase subunit C
MQIDRDEARRIARLAHLEFDDEGLDRMAGEMTTILTYIDQLREIDVSGVAGSRETGPFGAVLEATGATPLRDDEPRAPLERDPIAENAPEWRDGLFVVPKVLGGE